LTSRRVPTFQSCWTGTISALSEHLDADDALIVAQALGDAFLGGVRTAVSSKEPQA